MALCQLAYVSDIDRPCSPGDISNLVQAARRNNVRDNITGILLAGRGGFIQLVEGPRMAVIGLLDPWSRLPTARMSGILARECSRTL